MVGSRQRPAPWPSLPSGRLVPAAPAASARPGHSRESLGPPSRTGAGTGRRRAWRSRSPTCCCRTRTAALRERPRRRPATATRTRTTPGEERRPRRWRGGESKRQGAWWAAWGVWPTSAHLTRPLPVGPTRLHVLGYSRSGPPNYQLRFPTRLGPKIVFR